MAVVNRRLSTAEGTATTGIFDTGNYRLFIRSATVYAYRRDRSCVDNRHSRDRLCVDNLGNSQLAVDNAALHKAPFLAMCGTLGFTTRPASVVSKFAPAYTVDTFRSSATKDDLKSLSRA